MVMSLTAEGAFPWHTSYHYLQPILNTSREEVDIKNLSDNLNLSFVPESILEDKIESAETNVKSSFIKPPSNFIQETKLSKRSDERNKGNFNWGNLKQSSSNNVDNRQDDGVVLLVGIFNLLAVVVYAAQEFLSNNSQGKDKRVIQWQVQKVLDELVLRVHSSETAANLLSRALKSPSRYTFGRNLDDNTISSIVLEAFRENDSLKLRSWLDDAKNKLIEELSTIPETDLGPRIDPRIYRPLQDLYLKITETTRGGRSFSSSLIQEASVVAKTMSEISFNDVQSILKVVTKLGRMQRRYDVLPMLKAFLPLAFPTHILESELQFSPNHETEIVRKRRSALYPPFKIMRKLRQRQNSRSLRLPDKLKTKYPHKGDLEGLQQLNNTSVIMKRQGIVENLEYDDISGNWADKWFSLLTEVSPIALDFTNLYSKARSQPYCLRALLCKSNKYWRKRGTLHAAVTPFLSVIASWALEDSSPHSLGDSLIAVRAGWMEKDCQSIYPECEGNGKKQNSTTFDLSPSSSRPHNQVFDSSASNFLSKSGKILPTDDDDDDGKLTPKVESSILDPQIQLINSSSNILDAQIYHSSQPSETSLNPKPRNDLPPQSEMVTPQEYEELHSSNILALNHHLNYPEVESGISNAPKQILVSYNKNKIHPHLLSQMYQNSHQHPQHFQINNASSNVKQKFIEFEPSVTLHTNPHSEEHSSINENNIFGINSDASDEGFKKKYYDRYDRPETAGEMDYLMSSGSVSGMALQDRLVAEGRERNSSKKNDDSNRAQVNEFSRNQFENANDMKRDRYHEVTNKKSQYIMPPWAKEGAAAAFLSQPTYSNYIVSQKPAFLKYSTKSPLPYKPQKREPVLYLVKPSGFPKYKYGVRRGLPAGNVDGNGLLESTDNELFSSSLKYKKKQVLQPQSLALTDDRSNSRSITTSKPNKSTKLKKSGAKKQASKLSTQSPIEKLNTPKLFESKEVAQFSPDDAVTDVHRNEILHLYVRDRHIRDTSASLPRKSYVDLSI